MTPVKSCSKVVYHAGFHNPHEWLGTHGGPAEPEHVQVVGGCIQSILDRLDSDEVCSVAFPLIGCGLFGLDEALLARQFIEHVIRFAEERECSRPVQVFLVLPDEDLRETVMEAFVAALIERVSSPDPYPRLEIGIQVVDEFELQVARTHHEPWSAWMHTRLAELAVFYMFSYLASSCRPKPTLSEVAAEGTPLGFGKVTGSAMKLVGEGRIDPRKKTEGWTDYFARVVFGDKKSRAAISRIVADRNAIAHGRKSRATKEIREDLSILFGERWKKTTQVSGPPPSNGLSPWMVTRASGSKVAEVLLERWSSKHLRYLDPIHGRTIKVQAGEGQETLSYEDLE